MGEIFKQNLETVFISFGILVVLIVSIIVDKKKKTNISKFKKIALSALLISIHIVVTRYLSIQTQFLRISFEVIPIMLAGMILGPKYAVLIGGTSDLLGATVFATSRTIVFSWFYFKCSINSMYMWSFSI
jgi:ECF transporter S component (folate family)